MRDRERIEAYYSFGTIDYKSELFNMNKRGKNKFAYRVLRPLKLAALIWINAMKSLSSAKK